MSEDELSATDNCQRPDRTLSVPASSASSTEASVRVAANLGGPRYVRIVSVFSITEREREAPACGLVFDVKMPGAANAYTRERHTVRSVPRRGLRRIAQGNVRVLEIDAEIFRSNP